MRPAPPEPLDAQEAPLSEEEQLRLVTVLSTAYDLLDDLAWHLGADTDPGLPKQPLEMHWETSPPSVGMGSPIFHVDPETLQRVHLPIIMERGKSSPVVFRVARAAIGLMLYYELGLLTLKQVMTFFGEMLSGGFSPRLMRKEHFEALAEQAYQQATARYWAEQHAHQPEEGVPDETAPV